MHLLTVMDTMDVRPSGAWRIVQHDAVGHAYGFHAIHHSIVPSEQLVYTFEFEGMPGRVSLETVKFEELGGETMLTGQSVSRTVQGRDGMLTSGTEAGASEIMGRFAELLREIKKDNAIAERHQLFENLSHDIRAIPSYSNE
jgi:uncharacterized protein YndB with AHSA1/START domain